MPPAIFRRAEPMSDKLNAGLWNPYHAVMTSAAWLGIQNGSKVKPGEHIVNIGEPFLMQNKGNRSKYSQILESQISSRYL